MALDPRPPSNVKRSPDANDASALASHSTRPATSGIGGYDAPRLAMTGQVASAPDTKNGDSESLPSSRDRMLRPQSCRHTQALVTT